MPKKKKELTHFQRRAVRRYAFHLAQVAGWFSGLTFEDYKPELERDETHAFGFNAMQEQFMPLAEHSYRYWIFQEGHRQPFTPIIGYQFSIRTFCLFFFKYSVYCAKIIEYEKVEFWRGSRSSEAR